MCVFLKYTIEFSCFSFFCIFFKDGFTLGPDYNVRKSFIIVLFNGVYETDGFMSCETQNQNHIQNLRCCWDDTLFVNSPLRCFWFFCLLKAGIEIIQKKNEDFFCRVEAWRDERNIMFHYKIVNKDFLNKYTIEIYQVTRQQFERIKCCIHKCTMMLKHKKGRSKSVE